VFVMMVMAVSMSVDGVMLVFVGMAADFHIAAAKTASAFFAHKLVCFSANFSPDLRPSFHERDQGRARHSVRAAFARHQPGAHGVTRPTIVDRLSTFL